MRFAVTALATIVVLVVFLISGAAPTLSGMAVMPPCESAPPAAPAKLRAPTRLRIIGALGLDGLFARGPNAGAEVEYQTLGERAATTGDPHAYYVALASRRDCFAAYSLRDAAQAAVLYSADDMADMAYIYPADPDRRKQDALRIRIRPGKTGPAGRLIAAVGPTRGAHFFFAMDFWMGAEWDYTLALIPGHKNYTPVSFTVAEGERHGTWFGTQTQYVDARQHEHNQPPGGPYVAMIYPHINMGGQVKPPNSWRDGERGYPRARLPYGAPSKEQRSYPEAIQPFDTSVYPRGAEFGLVAERWTRIWHYFERAPAEDWVSDHPTTAGQAMHAYKWTMWFADTVREPTRIVNEGVVGIPTTSLGFGEAHMGFGSGNANDPAKDVVRGDLVAYTRNWVVLHGTSKTDVLALLKKPD